MAWPKERASQRFPANQCDLCPSQLFGLVGDVGFKQLADVLPTVADRFSPLFVGDHVVAV